LFVGVGLAAALVAVVDKLVHPPVFKQPARAAIVIAMGMAYDDASDLLPALRSEKRADRIAPGVVVVGAALSGATGVDQVDVPRGRFDHHGQPVDGHLEPRDGETAGAVRQGVRQSGDAQHNVQDAPLPWQAGFHAP
jgi:hypothetical protein